MQISITFDPNLKHDINEVRKFLDRLTGEQTVVGPDKLPVINIDTSNTRNTDTEEIQPEKGPILKHVDTPEAAKEEIELTIETLRANTQAAITAGFKNQIAALLQRLGAQSVSRIPKEQWAEYNTEVLKFHK